MQAAVSPTFLARNLREKGVFAFLGPLLFRTLSSSHAVSLSRLNIDGCEFFYQRSLELQ